MLSSIALYARRFNSGSTSRRFLTRASSSVLSPAVAAGEPHAKTAEDGNKTVEEIEQEFVTVLKLNMLQDNPGAVKKVRSLALFACFFLCVLLVFSCC